MMDDRLGSPDVLQPVSVDLGRMQGMLDRLGADDGAFLHGMLGTLLALPADQLRPGVVLLVGQATGGTDTDRLVRFAAAVQLVYAASLAHQTVRDDQSTAGEHDHVRVLAGDYLYAQAALITAGLHHFGVMSTLAAAIQAICARDLAGDAFTFAAEASTDLMGMFQLSALGAGLLSGCDERLLAALEDYGRALDRVDAGEAAGDGPVAASLLTLPDSPARLSLAALAETLAHARRRTVP